MRKLYSTVEWNNMYFGISQSKTWILFQTLSDSVIFGKLDTQGLTAHICKRQTIMPILLYYFEDVIRKVPSVVLGTFNLYENFFSLPLFYSHRSNNFLVGLCCIFYLTEIFPTYIFWLLLQQESYIFSCFQPLQWLIISL